MLVKFELVFLASNNLSVTWLFCIKPSVKSENSYFIVSLLKRQKLDQIIFTEFLINLSK